MRAPPPPPPPPPPRANNSVGEVKEDWEEESIKTTTTTTTTPNVPYSIPEWSSPPPHPYFLEVIKDGSILHPLQINHKGAFMFGRLPLCDFLLDHPTISRFHAVIQFNRNGDAFLYDTGSTHGTFLNKKQVEPRVFVDLHVGDVIRFGHSSRLYVFQGPQQLMPPEKDLKLHRDYKMRQEMLDREASLQRARREASLADGISWGMGEDAIEEAEDDEDEITWQTYKGQLTDKQEKTREKILKRTEKIAHMKKEIDAIRVKDIAQGGLTQGQQTQIARNEQRISQLLEEVENLEETLNDSIRESIGARAGVSHGKKKQTAEEDEDFVSDDDDDFYDRTKKPSVRKDGENQSVETADSLLDKRDAVVKEMEEKKELLLLEKDKMVSETAGEADAGDALDAYMSGLSSQLVLDKAKQIEKEISSLQSELDRTLFLLKIADPSGELAKRRDSKEKVEKAEVPSATKMQPPREAKSNEPIKPKQDEKIAGPGVATVEYNGKKDVEALATDDSEGETTVYTITKPQWLGAVDKKGLKEIQPTEAPNVDESDKFVGYKDRQKIRHGFHNEEDKKDSGIESAVSGLIIRKRKETEKPEASDNETHEQSTSSGVEFVAEDAVALLLKHERGYQAEDDGQHVNQEKMSRSEPSKDNKKTKRVLGPEKPTFLSTNPDYQSWVPPEGQSGDGRTALNDRYGY